MILKRNRTTPWRNALLKNTNKRLTNCFSSAILIKLIFSIMHSIKIILDGLLVNISLSAALFAQDGAPPPIESATKTELRYALNATGSNYFKFTALNQVWVRYTQFNRNSGINGTMVDNRADIGIRRLRFQLYGQLSERVFMYTQFGQNNFTANTPRFTGSFFHDAVVEYSVVKDQLSIGGGLTGWSGLARYASPSIGKIMTLDAPLYQQATNGVNDQFLRKLSIYAKGKFHKFNYRLAVSDPLSVQNGGANSSTLNGNDASFSPLPPNKQFQGYVFYAFKDEEDNTTPYTVGTYLGKKQVFNIGAGFIQQKDAMWLTGFSTDTTFHNMVLLGVDVFYDVNLNKGKNDALTVYAAFTNYDFGPNYIRNVGVMNPGNSSEPFIAHQGYPVGNSFAMIGTGRAYYSQVGYLFAAKIGHLAKRFQIFGSILNVNYEVLSTSSSTFEMGGNLFLTGDHSSKLSVMYQNRPVNNTIISPFGDGWLYGESYRKGMFVLQYQVSI
jgi:hypothetical protein